MKKTHKFQLVAIALMGALVTVSCDNNDDDNTDPIASIDFSGNFVQQDQMARPAINTVFIAPGATKDEFNGTTPSAMGAKYQSVFQSRLLALNKDYTTNALGQTASAFTGLLATDVLNVSKTGQTTFFDGQTNKVLTGRTFGDDVIDVELFLIFGGPMGTSNPGLTSDNVDANDKPFATTFPYLGAAF